MWAKDSDNKKAQEEMIGFALIIILVAVIALVFLWFSSSQGNEQELDNTEVENFLNAYVTYTSNCTDRLSGYKKISELVKECKIGSEEQVCGERNACEALNRTSKKILNNSWQVGPNRPDKGYKMTIRRTGKKSVEIMTNITNGNTSRTTFRGGTRSIPAEEDKENKISLRIYS